MGNHRKRVQISGARACLPATERRRSPQLQELGTQWSTPPYRNRSMLHTPINSGIISHGSESHSLAKNTPSVVVVGIGTQEVKGTAVFLTQSIHQGPEVARFQGVNDNIRFEICISNCIKAGISNNHFIVFCMISCVGCVSTAGIPYSSILKRETVY